MPTELREKVELFFKNEFISVKSVTRRTAEAARAMVYDYGIAPKDAVHVATALEFRLPILNTFDGGLLSKSGGVGGDPILKIEKPSVRQPSLDV